MKAKLSLSLLSLLLCATARAANLSLGADYLLRGVSIEDRDTRVQSSSYYDQRIEAYLTTDLSKDVEASFRVQSVGPWGLEGSTNSLTENTRYPSADGNVWIQNAFVRLPNIWKGNIALTVGRQPIQWGDGHILADDHLGFNAIRLHLRSPWRAIEFDVDGFTAKINEGIRGNTDTDLHGVVLGYDRESVRWEFMGLFENNKSGSEYEVGADTTPFASKAIERMIYGVRFITNLKDAYLKAAYYQQGGKVTRLDGGNKIDLKGSGYMIGVGGKQDTKKFGRFGAVLEFSEGSGDKGSTEGTDEAFRPTFASRWSGLERQGYGRYFAATMSDAYSPDNPFSNASAQNDGLPDGVSGIQTGRFGMELTPWAAWTFTFDYYQYKARSKNSAVSNSVTMGNKELGTELDFGIEYRYSGLVTARIITAGFTTGDAYDEQFRQDARRTDIEVEVKF